MLRPTTPGNHTWSQKSHKNCNGPHNPLPEGECTSFNTSLDGKHDDQTTNLLSVSVHPRSFLWHDHVHRTVWGDKNKGMGTPRTNGFVCRPEGDTDWQFRLKVMKDTRVLRPSCDHTRSCRTREDVPLTIFHSRLFIEKNVKISYPVPIPPCTQVILYTNFLYIYIFLFAKTSHYQVYLQQY